MRRAQQYSAVGEHGQDGLPIQWYWTVSGYLTSWLLAGGLLMLPDTFDTSSGFRVTKTFLSVFAIALIVAGLCFTMLLMVAVRDWTFRANSLMLPAFSSCLIGTLTIWYSFIIQQRYVFDLAGILSALFACLLTAFYGMFTIFSQRCASLDKELARRRQIPLNQTSYDGLRAHDPSPNNLPMGSTDQHDPNYLKGYAPVTSPPNLPSAHHDFADNTYNASLPQSSYPVTRVPSNAISTITRGHQHHDSISILTERPSATTLNQRHSDTSLNGPQNTATMTDEELTRQQMLMLLMTKPEDALITGQTGRPRAESGYRIDWENEEEAYSPAAELATSESNPTFGNSNRDMRDRLLAAANAGRLPPGYFERQWDGVWRKSSDLHHNKLHPTSRESRFLKTGGDREARRREIERMGTRSVRGST